MKNRKILLIAFTSCWFALETTQAQVNIGGNITPPGGSLLNLQSKPVVGQDRSTANAGLLLPRVALRKAEELYPMYSYKGENTPSENDLRDHIGLVVYNTTNEPPKPSNDPCEPFPDMRDIMQRGVMVWNGKKWVNLIESEETSGKPKDPSWLAPGVSLVYDHEGNAYTYRQFGDAGIWTTLNMRARTYSPNNKENKSGTFELIPEGGLRKILNLPPSMAESDVPITQKERYFGYPRIHDGKSSPGPAMQNDVDFMKNTSLGLLYTRAAALNGVLDKEYVQGICPDGWHVSTSKEWAKLVDYFNDHPDDAARYPAETPSSDKKAAFTASLGCGEYMDSPLSAGLQANNGGFAAIPVYFGNITNGAIDGTQLWEFLECSGIPTKPGTNVAAGNSKSAIDLEQYHNIKLDVGYNRQLLSIRCVKDGSANIP